MKVVIFGATGFLGQKLLKCCEAAGWEAVAFDMSILGNHGFRYELTPLKRKLLLQHLLMLRPDAIVNMAWNTRGSDYRQSLLNLEFETFANNLFDICIECNIKQYVFAGSSAEYGEDPGYCDENHSILVPTDLYSIAKLRVFRRTVSLTPSWLKLSWVRIFQPFGRSSPSEKLFSKIINSFDHSVPFFVRSPDTKLDWISTESIAVSIREILKNELTGVFNLGTSQGTTLRELVYLINTTLYRNSKSIVNFGSEPPITCVAAPNSYLVTNRIIPKLSIEEALKKEFR